VARDLAANRSRAGETLVESLVAITILSMVAIAAYAGLRTSLSSSSQHRETAEAETILRSAAERLQDPRLRYIDRAGCPGVATYGDLPARPGYALVPAITFWAPPAVTAVPDAFSVASFRSCTDTTSDRGLQRIHLSVTTPSNFTESLVVLKRRSDEDVPPTG
jgi:type II secretory pathway pseudopilin PulG